MKKLLVGTIMGMILFTPSFSDALSVSANMDIPVYSKTNTQSVLMNIKEGSKIEVDDFFGDYYIYEQGWMKGYIKKEDISKNNKIVKNKKEEFEILPIFGDIPLSDNVTQLGLDVSALAKTLIGTPYVWAGQSIDGFDCSGFTSYLYKSNGISIPRTSKDQFSEMKIAEYLEPGDLVFFNTFGEGVSHVGVYIGDSKFIHSSSTKKGVVEESMNNKYYKERYLGARRP